MGQGLRVVSLERFDLAEEAGVFGLVGGQLESACKIEGCLKLRLGLGEIAAGQRDIAEGEQKIHAHSFLLVPRKKSDRALVVVRRLARKTLERSAVTGPPQSLDGFRLFAGRGLILG